MCRSAWTCIASAPRSRSWTPPVTSSVTATSLMTRSSWCRSLACWRRARRSPSRPPTAGAGWWSCWRSWSWNRTWSTPAAVRRSPRPGSRTTRSMRAPWPSCSGPTCSPRPGSPRRRSVTCGPCCATGPAWSGGHRREEPGARRAGRPWHHATLEPVGHPGTGVACRAGAAANPTRDHRGLLRGAGCPGQADRPPGGGDRRAGQARPQGPGPHGFARRRQADGHDPARRDR
jgi:hypothetical protein